MPNPGAWTVDAAQDALPKVKGLLATARQHAATLHELEAHLNDLRIVWGDAVLTATCPGHQEFRALFAKFQSETDAMARVLAAFQALGVEVKDVEQGLVDFRGRVGTEEAYICWKDGEGAIAWWHPLEGGFAARRRLP